MGFIVNTRICCSISKQAEFQPSTEPTERIDDATDEEVTELTLVDSRRHMQSVHQVKEPNPSSYSVYKSKWDESCGKQSQVICNSLYFVKTDDIMFEYKILQIFTLVSAVLQAIKSADSLVLRKEWVGDFDCTYTAENLGTDDNIIELGKEWINIMHSEDEKSKPDNIGWNLCFYSIFCLV